MIECKQEDEILYECVFKLDNEEHKIIFRKVLSYYDGQHVVGDNFILYAKVISPSKNTNNEEITTHSCSLSNSLSAIEMKEYVFKFIKAIKEKLKIRYVSRDERIGIDLKGHILPYACAEILGLRRKDDF